MKKGNTIIRNAPALALSGFLALPFAISAFVSLQSGPALLTAAAVTETGGDGTAHSLIAGLPDFVGEWPAAYLDPVEWTESERDVERSANERTAGSEEESTAGASTGTSIGEGEASYYGAGFSGRPTASGETFDPAQLTAAHRTLPFGSKVRVTNKVNGRSVVVRVNDRGPFVADRLIDVSSGAAEKLGMIRSGTARVELELL